jgi:hypothetical protein
MENEQAIFKKGEALFVDRQFEEAEKYFLHAIAIRPDTLWLIYLGETYAYLAYWQKMEETIYQGNSIGGNNKRA